MFDELLKKCDKLMKEIKELKTKINILEKSNIIKLPYKVGDTIYIICARKEIKEETIYHIEIYKNTIYVCTNMYTEDARDYNKFWFTNKTLAEQRLKELQNGKK